MKDRYEQDNIDDLFHDALGQGERKPPAQVWDKIEAGLDKDKRRRLLLWWSSSLVAAGIVVSLSGVWFWKAKDRSHLSQGLNATAKQPAAARGDDARADAAYGHADADEHAHGNAGAGEHARGLAGEHPGAHAAGPAQMSHPTRIRDDMAGVGPAPAAAFKSYWPVLPEVVSPGTGEEPRFRFNVAQPAAPSQGVNRRAVPGRPQPRLAITAYISQEMAGYSLADHDSTGPHGKEIEKRENSSFSSSIGLLATYNLSRHWAIESGISVSRSVSVSNAAKVIAGKDNGGGVSYQIYTITGYGYLVSPATTNIGDSAMTGKTTGRLNYVSIPVLVSGMWAKQRFTVLAGAGFSTNFLTRATVQTSLSGPAGDGRQREVSQYGLRKVTFGMLARGECRYQVSGSYSVCLLATFKNSVGPVNAHTSYSTYPYNLGIGIGMTRTF